MKKQWNYFFLGVTLFLIGAIFAGCDLAADSEIDGGGKTRQVYEVQPADGDTGVNISETGIIREETIEPYRRKHLAYLKTLDNYKLDRETLQMIAISALRQVQREESASSNYIVMDVKTIPIEMESRFERGGIGSDVDVMEEEPITLYEFALRNNNQIEEWYVLTSNDVRIGFVLAITEGSLEYTDNSFVKVFHSHLYEYIDSIVLEYNDITEEEVERAREASAVVGQERAARATISGGYNNIPGDWVHYYTDITISNLHNPLLTTKWGQGDTGPITSTSPAYNNIVKSTKGTNWIISCGPVALSQIVAYHGRMNPNATFLSRKPIDFTNDPLKGTWSGTFNLNDFRGYPTIFNDLTTDAGKRARGQVAAFMATVAADVNMNDRLVNGKQFTDLADAVRTFGNLGYSVNGYYSATQVTGTTNGNFSLNYYLALPTIKTALNNNRPFYMLGQETGYVDNEGHFWVVDGYGEVSYITEYYHHINNSSLTATRSISLNNCLLVHCNLGWEGNNYGYSFGYTNHGGWYVYGIFDASLRSLLDKSITGGRKNYSTGTYVLIPWI